MASELRNTGISIIGEVSWGTHFCHFYETKQDLLDTLVPYFKTGLESKEFCLWVVSNAELITVEEAKRALAQAVPDLDRHLSDENIEILNGLDWYLEENVFNLERVTNASDAKLKRKLALGYDGMRVSGDTFWLAEKDWKDFFAYEKQLNESITDQPMTVLCTYPLSKSGAAEVLDVVQAHQFAIARRQGEWEVIETPELKQAKAEIRKLNEELEQRVVERTGQLAKAVEDLTDEISVRKQSEVELSRAHQRLSYHVENTPLAVIEWDKDLFIKRWSKRAEEVFGWKASETLGINMYDPDFHIVYEGDAQAVGEIARQLMKGTTNSNLSLNRNYTKDGKVIFCEWYNSVLRDEDGNVITILSLVHDVTERKQAEDALRCSEDHLRLVLDTTPALIHTGRPDGYLDYFSQRWLQYVGRSLEELQGWGWTASIHPDDVERIVNNWRERLASGEPFQSEARVRQADGEYRWMLHRKVPLRNEQGNIIKWYGSSVDIEDRKRTEEALKESQRRLEEAQRIAHVGHWERDLETGLITWSDEIYRILGLPPPENDSPPTEWQHIIHPEDRQRVSLVIEEAKRGVRRYDVEYRIVRPDGDVRILHSQGDIIRDEQGRPFRAFGIAQDITQRKLVEEALNERLRFETLVTELSAAFANLSPNEVDHEIDKWLQTLVEFLGVDRASFLQFEEDWTTLYRSHSYTAGGITQPPPPPIVLKDQLPWITDQLRRGVTVKWARVPDDMPEEAAKEKEYAARLGIRSGLNIPVRIGGSVICAIAFTSITTYRDWPDAMVARLRLVGEIFAAAVERKRAEAALRKSEEQFRQLAENIREVFWLATGDLGKMLYISPAYEAVWGQSRESLYREPRSFVAAIHDEDRSRVAAIIEREREQGFEVEYRVVRPDGSIRWIWDRGFPIKDESGRFYRVAGIAEDVTERKDSEESSRATTEQLRTLSARIQSAKEEEGARIARELHDELGSTLTGMKWGLEEIEGMLSATENMTNGSELRQKISVFTTLIESTLDTVRRISSELRPSILDDLGLAAAIRWQAQQFEERTGIACNFSSSTEAIDLSGEQSTAVFRISQEALTNIVRHAQATRVDIAIKIEHGQFVLTISDNGKGIKANEKVSAEAFGLLGMRERAHLVGGEVTINGNDGRGTLVTVRLPVGQPTIRRMTR